MSRSGRSVIKSVLTAKDLRSFVETFNIPGQFSPTLPDPNEPAVFTPDVIPLYTLAFSSYGVRYPLSSFKVDLLRHFGVHFSQLHPLGWMRVVHFELSCAAISGEPSIPLFCMFYKLISDGDWFTFAKRQNNVSKPCYSFMPTSTYPKDWKSRFIFVSAAIMPESPLPRDVDAPIKDDVPTLSANETGDSKDVQFVVDGEVVPGLNRSGVVPVTGGSAQAGGSAAVEGGEGTSSDGEESSPDHAPVKHSDRSDDKDLEIRLVRKRKAASPQPVPIPRDIRQRLRSASGQKLPLPSKAASERPLLGSRGSSRDPIEITTGPSSSRVRDKTPEVGLGHFTSAFELSPLHATGTSKPTEPEGLTRRSPLAPLFADAIPFTYVPKWKVTNSSVIGTPEAARDFLSHAVPPSHKFMNSALRDDLFEDQYSMSLCESFFRGAGMLQRIDDLRRANEGLKGELKTSQSVTAELRCQVVEAERRLQEEKGTGIMLEQRKQAWEREMAVLVEEKEELAAELKHLKEVGSSEDFKSGLEEIYRAYGDVGYQAGLKDGYAYSAQGLGRKETPLYNSKAKKKLSKLDEELGSKTPVILKKILEHPLISIDELKALFSSAGPSSPPSLSGGAPQ
ncbi:hypothetical protein HanHA300_Chr17g0671341 [Helianthus annuus]|nr:hypothetical protein HanHA300_Chr17g0671341 [Helianthus annuus]KAJ0435575.1 hypothetical protein HanIR_Chr17g0894811 [Helianthus annuus]KAJ0633957.1 hypothetical protein HanLR1_Chr17g0682671 [Helianthus annuus]